MVYARTVGDKTIHLGVSGWLWNRSLIMQDDETDTMWSHLLGEAMKGELKGRKLRAVPSDMVTWHAWLAAHPRTTVLNLPRTSRAYTRQVYRTPGRFVFGWQHRGRAHHCSFATLMKTPVLNLEPDLVLAFDRQGTAARLYRRRAGKQVLTFEARPDGRLRDRETGTLWKAATGEAVEGPLKGARLAARVGIVSFARTWRTFHPDSREIRR